MFHGLSTFELQWVESQQLCLWAWWTKPHIPCSYLCCAEVSNGRPDDTCKDFKEMNWKTVFTKEIQIDLAADNCFSSWHMFGVAFVQHGTDWFYSLRDKSQIKIHQIWLALVVKFWQLTLHANCKPSNYHTTLRVIFPRRASHSL